MIAILTSSWGELFVDIWCPNSFNSNFCFLFSVQPVEYKYESSESEEDSEDSNAEGNYKNDYPDTEESCEDDLE